MSGIVLEGGTASLLEPVRPTFEAALARLEQSLGAIPDLRVDVAPVDGFSVLEGEHLLLSEALRGPGHAHPDEPTELLLDRWRRALGEILEALVLRALASARGRPPGVTWQWRGVAIDLVDRAAPDLGLAAPDLAVAVRTGDLGAHPRAGVAVAAWMRRDGRDPVHLLDVPIPLSEWLRAARWILDPDHGPASRLPLPVARVEAADVPVELPPWSFRPLLVPPHPRGGRIVVEGDGLVDAPWAPGGVAHRALAVAGAGGCALAGEPGGPVGHWDVGSARGFGQIFGARGITFSLRPSGRLEIVFADAFVGPLAALEVAEVVGSSGTASGVWAIAGDHLLRFARIVRHGLTVHQRQGGFAIPEAGFGVSGWLSALQEGPWRWEEDGDDRLVLRGRMLGGDVEVRMRRAT